MDMELGRTHLKYDSRVACIFKHASCSSTMDENMVFMLVSSRKYSLWTTHGSYSFCLDVLGSQQTHEVMLPYGKMSMGFGW
jgi:hypothetical protein